MSLNSGDWIDDCNVYDLEEGDVLQYVPSKSYMKRMKYKDSDYLQFFEVYFVPDDASDEYHIELENISTGNIEYWDYSEFKFVCKYKGE